MGILDSKTRVLDVFLTQEGRRQAVQGNLRIKFATFTDDSTYYKADIISGSTDATQRIYFEANNLPQDQITFEANDAGRLNAFKNSNGIIVRDGRIISSSIIESNSTTYLTASNEVYTVLSGEEFFNSAQKLLSSSIDNFQKLRILSTHNEILDYEDFELTKNNIEFTILRQNQSETQISIPYISSLESLISDKRLSTQLNFKYLPPNQQIKATKKYKTFGKYPILGLTKELSIDEVNDEISELDKLGFVKTIRFDPTSKQNTLITQIFELTHNELTKLDVIEFIKTSKAHIFFVGKVFTDDYGDDTFLNMFTLVFS